MAVFVHDLLVTGNDLVQIDKVKGMMAAKFTLTDEVQVRLESFWKSRLEYRKRVERSSMKILIL